MRAVNIKSVAIVSKTVCLLAVSFLPFLLNPAEANPLLPAQQWAYKFRLPDTPFLPPYAGSIISAQAAGNPQADGGIIYTINFETAEQPSQVLSWYRLAFQQYGWLLESNQNGTFTLNAQHGQIKTSITLTSPRKRGARSQVQLYYRYAGKEV